MSWTTLSRVQELLAGIAELISKVSGVRFWVFLTGFIVLLALSVALAIKLVVALIRTIPNLTVGQFIKLVLVVAVVLIVIGIFLP